MNKAVFLDRNGTINADEGHFHDAEKLAFLRNVKEGLKMLSGKYMLIVISNQGGIELGIFTGEDCRKVDERISEELSKEGVEIKKFYCCPHSKDGGCGCRKPEPGMIFRAVKEFRLDLNGSWFIGDATRDIKTVENLKQKYPGFRSILVLTGEAGKDGKFAVKPDFTAKDMVDAARIILDSGKPSKIVP